MSNDTAKTNTINILPVQGIFNEDHSIVTFIGPAGDPFYAPLPPGGGVTSFDGGTTGLTPATATSGPVSLGGTLGTNNGGTGGTAAPTAGGVSFGTGSAYAFTAAGTSGQVLTSSGSGSPTWETPASGSIIITDDTTTNGTRYPLYSTATTGSVSTEYTSSTKYTYNPSSGTLAATAFSGSGAALTALNASNVSSGTLSVSYGGTGVTSAATNGQLLIGNGSGYTLSTLTAGANVTITNSSGGITIAASGGGGSSLTITDDTTTNATRYPLFTSATSGTITTEYVSSTKYTFNPSTGAFSVAGQIESTANGFKFPDGSVQTTAATGGGSSLSITDTTTNATFYPTFTSATSGTISTEYINSTALTYNPSTSVLTNGGQIYSTAGGYKFPDGTVQTTASTGGGGGSNAQAQAYAWFIH